MSLNNNQPRHSATLSWILPKCRKTTVKHLKQSHHVHYMTEMLVNYFPKVPRQCAYTTETSINQKLELDDAETSCKIWDRDQNVFILIAKALRRRCSTETSINYGHSVCNDRQLRWMAGSKATVPAASAMTLSQGTTSRNVRQIFESITRRCSKASGQRRCCASLQKEKANIKMTPEAINDAASTTSRRQRQWTNAR